MILKMLTVGAYEANCYIVGSEKDRSGMVIDPGDEAGRIISEIKNLNLQIKTIVLTHGHADHTGAAMKVKKETGAEIAVHEDDISLINNEIISAILGFSRDKRCIPDKLLNDGDVVSIGGLNFNVIHTPGHSSGGICLSGEGVLFSGDTLFENSIGRTDLPGSDGDYEIIIKSIKDKLMTLDDKITVYPGHGPKTTIGAERRGNPFITSA
ncbi:MAG: MBL fold metallo-hydrolase [Dehalococcoidales bacterium]|nr:MBL fold metallo-hydrolase [Dehalococcoidales bacterium]